MLLGSLGNNTGNMLFGSAIQRIFKNGFPSNSMKIPTKEELESTCSDGIVIAAANWLQPRTDFESQWQQLRNIDVPVVICGLGAQSMDGNIPQLKDGTINFLRLISERSKYLSVRGNFTAKVLEKYGIHNVVVTGCPSLLWHCDHPAYIHKKPLICNGNKISISATIPAKDFSRVMNKRMTLAHYLLGQCLKHGLDLVAQTELPLMRLKNGNQTQQDLTFLKSLVHPYDLEYCRNWAKTSIKYFASTSDWISYCSNKSFVVGTRLHGIVSALLSGTPALLITHDKRTIEMSKQASIPNISSETILKMGDLDFQRLRDGLEIDAFNERQKTYFNEFKHFWELNDVQTTLG